MDQSKLIRHHDWSRKNGPAAETLKKSRSMNV
jgi:hypothetical protein